MNSSLSLYLTTIGYSEETTNCVDTSIFTTPSSVSKSLVPISSKIFVKFSTNSIALLDVYTLLSEDSCANRLYALLDESEASAPNPIE